MTNVTSDFSGRRRRSGVVVVVAGGGKTGVADAVSVPEREKK